MNRWDRGRGLCGWFGLAAALGFSALAAGCSVDYSDVVDESFDGEAAGVNEASDGSEGVDNATMSSDVTSTDDASSELQTRDVVSDS